jgi:hypothetical protein
MALAQEQIEELYQEVDRMGTFNFIDFGPTCDITRACGCGCDTRPDEPLADRLPVTVA